MITTAKRNTSYLKTLLFIIQLQRDDGWTDGSRAGRKTKIFQVYSKPSYSPSRGGGDTNSSCVKFANEPKSNDAILTQLPATHLRVRTLALNIRHAPSFFLTFTQPNQDNRHPTNFTAHTLTMSFLVRTPALRRQIVQSRTFVPSRGVHGYKVYIHSLNLHRPSLCSRCTYSTYHSNMKVQRQFSASRLPFSFSLGSPSQDSPLTISCMSIFRPSPSVSILQPQLTVGRPPEVHNYSTRLHARHL
jgi:hypothetical protein